VEAGISECCETEMTEMRAGKARRILGLGRADVHAFGPDMRAFFPYQEMKNGKPVENPDFAALVPPR
jgi:hypothetical protein